MGVEGACSSPMKFGWQKVIPHNLPPSPSNAPPPQSGTKWKRGGGGRSENEIFVAGGSPPPARRWWSSTSTTPPHRVCLRWGKHLPHNFCSKLAFSVTYHLLRNMCYFLPVGFKPKSITAGNMLSLPGNFTKWNET